MRDDQTPDSQRSVQLHFGKLHGREKTLSVSTSLQELDLSRKDIEDIDLGPLSCCIGLQKLDLHNNQLLSIDLSPLASCSSLQKLDLSVNQLQSIDLMPLASCCSLEDLNLSNNDLESIDLSPLSSCAGLHRLDLNFNILSLSIDLSPLSSCTGLRRLEVQSNQLQNIILPSCTSLQVLTLSDNHLESIDLTPLRSCTSLDELFLNDNQLQSIDLSPLSSCASLDTIYLGNNEIRSIDLTPLSALPRLQYFDLSANLLECVSCALDYETMRLLLPRLDEDRACLFFISDKERLSGPDMALLTPIVDALWHLSDESERWRAHAIVQYVLSKLGFAWLGLLDVDPTALMSVLNGDKGNGEPVDSIIGLVCRQIDVGGTTAGFDIDRMTEHAGLALRMPRVLDLRRAEMGLVTVLMRDRYGPDLHALWLTAYGHMVLSSLGLGTLCSKEILEQVKGALERLGFDLKQTEKDAGVPSNVSGPLSEYIWELADFRSKKKR